MQSGGPVVYDRFRVHRWPGSLEFISLGRSSSGRRTPKKRCDAARCGAVPCQGYFALLRHDTVWSSTIKRMKGGIVISPLQALSAVAVLYALLYQELAVVERQVMVFFIGLDRFVGD